MADEKREAWREALADELASVTAIAGDLGFSVDTDQPHLTGERYLLGGATKLVLNAHKDGARYVIKASRNPTGILELEREKRGRDALSTFSFASDALKMPPEIHFGVHGPYHLLITEYIEQKEVLFEKSLEERFFMSLRALEAQESFHATTYEHLQEVRKHLPIFDAQAYIDSVRDFLRDCHDHPDAVQLMDAIIHELERNRVILERYNGYLAHFDFVPHNLRVDGHTLWILDFSELRFGSKYESWARLINYMLIHDQPLAEALLTYVEQERGADEAAALRIMRIYKAALLVAFYARTLPKTEGAYRELTELRMAFWIGVAQNLLAGVPFREADAAAYRERRDALRSQEEVERQKGFNLV